MEMSKGKLLLILFIGRAVLTITLDRRGGLVSRWILAVGVTEASTTFGAMSEFVFFVEAFSSAQLHKAIAKINAKKENKYFIFFILKIH
jgi:hypothetical protein